jgi:hypothetical protein
MHRSPMMNAAIAAALLAPISNRGQSVELVQRDPDTFSSPVAVRESKSHTFVTPYLASEIKKQEAKRKRKKIANASRKRNRK